MASDNYFYLSASGGVTYISFSYNNNIQYTTGEDFDGVTVSGATNQVTVDVKVDRKASSGPATWFKNALNNDPSCMFTNVVGDSMPGELNFALSGVLTVTCAAGTFSYTVYLGQGSYGAISHNNWWIGSLELDQQVLATMFQMLMSDANEASIQYGNNNVTDNKVSLISTSGLVTGFSYNNDLQVSPGQIQTGVNWDDSDLSNITIDAQASRSNSTTVADWFNGALGGTPLHMYTNPIIFAGDQMPEELNMAFSIQLQMQGSQNYQIYLGQGNAGLNNNWWFGSMDLLSLHKTLVGTNIDLAIFFKGSIINLKNAYIETVSGTGSETFYISQLHPKSI